MDVVTLQSALAQVKKSYAPALRRRDLPGVAALPVLNATPPTLTNGVANAASVISSGITWQPDDAGAFAFFGGNWKRGTSFPGQNGVSTGSGYPSGQTSASPGSVEFVLDTADSTGRFEVYTQSGGGVRVLTKVNGHWLYASQGASFTQPGDGNLYRNLVTLGAPGIYTIGLEFVGGAWFFGVTTAPTDSVRAPRDTRRRIIVVGDSYTEPTITDTATTKFPGGDGYPQLLRYALNADVWSAGKGGTGYLATNTGASVKFRDRLAADVIANSPDEVWWAGGINDSATPSALQTEAAACFAQVKAALPNCRQVVLSPFWRSSVRTYTPGMLNNRDAIRAAAVGAGLTYLDVLNEPTSFTGSGTLALPTAVNANSIKVTTGAWPLFGSYAVVIGAGLATAECRMVGFASVTNNGDGTFSMGVATLTYAHTAGETVTLVGSGFLTGTGKQGSLANDGCADRFVGNDSTHPTVAGHRNLADHLFMLYEHSLPA